MTRYIGLLYSVFHCQHEGVEGPLKTGIFSLIFRTSMQKLEQMFLITENS